MRRPERGEPIAGAATPAATATQVAPATSTPTAAPAPAPAPSPSPTPAALPPTGKLLVGRFVSETTRGYDFSIVDLATGAEASIVTPGLRSECSRR